MVEPVFLFMISGIMLHSFLCVWLLSCSTLLMNLTHTDAGNYRSFTHVTVLCSTVVTHPTADEYPGSFPFMAIVGRAVMNILGYAF